MGACVRTTLLAFITLTLVGGGIFTDYYFRHELSRKAKRFLRSENIPITVESVVQSAREGDIAILEQLELAGVSPGAPLENGTTPLLEAMRAERPEVVDFLIGKEAVIQTVNQTTTPDRDTPLAYALREGDFAMAETLIQLGASINIEKIAGVPFLIDAVKTDDREMIDFLMKHNVDVSYQGATPHTAFAIAMNAGDKALMKSLSDAGADLNTIGVTGNPLLIEAVKENSYEKIEFLLAKGADVNIRTSETSGAGLTAMSFAVSQQDGWIIDALLEAGFDTNHIGPQGDALLYEAVEDHRYDLADLFLKKGALPDSQGSTGESVLGCAVRMEDLQMVELLLAGGADPNFALEKEDPPLLTAIGAGNIAIAKRLIEEGADFDGPGMLAKSFESRDDPLLNLLLNSGGSPESKLPGTDRRVFDIAVEEGATSAVRSLLTAGADIGDNLWAALLTGQDDLVSLILDGGASPQQAGPDGEDPLAYCLNRERYRAARMLLDAGADPNARYDERESWLAKAVYEGNAPLADALLDFGAKPIAGALARDGHTLLGWAIAHNMTDVATGLINAGVDVEAYERNPARSSFKEKFDSTTFKYHLTSDSRIRALMMAAAQRNHDIAQALMDAGAKGNVYSRKYLFPVGIGSWYKDVKMMQIVLLGEAPKVQPRKCVIDLSSQRATLYENGVAVYSTRVSTGKGGYRTPAGEYVITDKHRHHNSSIYGSSMPYFQRFSCGAFGLHQGYVPNYPASHGCIRCPWDGAKTLFYKMKVGDYCVIQP